MASDILDHGLSIGDSLQNELELLLRDRHNRDIVNQESQLSMYRSGSAPPTIQGSLRSVGTLYQRNDFQDVSKSDGTKDNGSLTEDEIRSHPDYLSYYYSHENINPRLPPPLLSKEEWRVAQRFHGMTSSITGADDWRNKRIQGDGEQGTSLFSMQPGLADLQAENNSIEGRNASSRDMSRQASSVWLDTDTNGHTIIPRSGMGVRRKSFADILQEGLERTIRISEQVSRHPSCNALSEPVGFDAQEHMLNSHLCSAVPGSSLSRNRTPEPQLIVRSPGPVGGPVGSIVRNGSYPRVSDLSDIEASLSGIGLSKARYSNEGSHVESQLQMRPNNLPGPAINLSNAHGQTLRQQYLEKYKNERLVTSASHGELSISNGFAVDLKANDPSGAHGFPRRAFSSANLHLTVTPPGFSHLDGLVPSSPRMSFNGLVERRYAVNKDNILDSGLTTIPQGRILSTSKNQDGTSRAVDPQLVSYLRQQSPGHGTETGFSPTRAANFLHDSFLELQKAYLEALRVQQKQQYELSLLSSGMNHGYHVHNSYGFGMPYTGIPMAGGALSSYGDPRSPIFQNDQQLHALSKKNLGRGGSPRSYNSDVGTNRDGKTASTLLEEFKNNKARAFELSDIVGHVTEFSTDQYGSRFIQQKLETARVEEKKKIFSEIISHARTLMTDVFGNYIIQKFFEYGTDSQRKGLASQLKGHVLPLSLQMYGCRVIQKALEVVDDHEKNEIVAELDGSVVKCVRDQNGNHVIQKCIECVPEDQIHFIILSFHGQVVSLSTHPYGCRVIQRVLEHCNNPETQEIIMDEVMQSVCTLAQNQYGNYVIQHILQHGKPHERSDVISKLAGQIVKMSQQKFASNVIEKCLTFGGPEEKQLVVDEMLGSADENEPLQAMMKDPFGNYVVQKVLETCDDQNLELILSRIKVHLNGLKRYSYGKHIASRIEKLITTGERRIGLTSLLSK